MQVISNTGLEKLLEGFLQQMMLLVLLEVAYGKMKSCFEYIIMIAHLMKVKV